MEIEIKYTSRSGETEVLVCEVLKGAYDYTAWSAWDLEELAGDGVFGSQEAALEHFNDICWCRNYTGIARDGWGNIV